MLPFILLAASGCIRIEEEDKGSAQELITVSFKAVMEDNQTKTALDGGLGDAYRSLKWLPTDEIAVSTDYQWSEHYKFSSIDSEPTESGNFSGEIPESGTYYAVYPYSAVNSWNDYGRNLQVYIPNKQIYAENTFATDMNPMVARGARGEVLQFKNLCGLLAINLKSQNNDVVKSVSLAAYDANGNLTAIAGNYDVRMDFDYESGPVLTNSTTQASMILMDCGDGVQLNGDTSVPFHFVLAPGDYSKIAVIVTTTDGKTMIREGKNPLTIKRAEWVSAGALSYIAAEDFDLSEGGYANCYIVSSAGLYSFNASVIGNGEFGMVPNAGFHTTDPTISPVKAEILWEDRPGVIAGAACADGRISFVATGIEGNALIAAKDADGTILWSWHIWSTDSPVQQTYRNALGTFILHDRNLGATRAERGAGEEWRESVGVLFQYGRKDPFYQYYNANTGNWTKIYTTTSTRLSIAESIQMPSVFATGNSHWESNNLCHTLWSENVKTIYDPCPSGYKVASTDAWYGFSGNGETTEKLDDMNVSGSYDYGWNFIINDNNQTSWYPAGVYIGYHGSSEQNYEEGYVWGVDGNTLERLSYWYRSGLECNIRYWKYDHHGYGFPVRCMKDDNIVTTIVTVSEITGITTSSAKVSGYVSVDGNRTVTRRGFVYGTSSDLTLDNGIIIESGEGAGAFSADITELSAETKYYVRAFAVVDGDTVYSNANTFTTPNEAGVIDLSAVGTANCYMVSHAGTYKFKATVKGNGVAFTSNKSGTEKTNIEKTEISPNAVKILWETLNTADAVTEGCVIKSVSLEGGYVTFTTSDVFTPGNALIAVTYAGKVIWSWHIWAVDSDPEADAQVYPSGAMMMDRNLGALNVTAGDTRSYGLFYQWGRKDPFLGSSGMTNDNYVSSYPVAEGSNNAIVRVSNDSSYDNFAYALANPTNFIQYSYWNDDDEYWDYHKTMYDPCPVGWRVPDQESGVWEGLSVSRYFYGSHMDLPSSKTSAFYPSAGHLDANGNLSSVNSTAYMWMANDRRVFHTSSYLGTTYYSCYDALSVRCMKDAVFTLTTDDYPEAIADVYAVVTGNLTISDNTVMDVKGIIFSHDTSDLKLGKEYCTAVNAENANDGEIRVTISGLKPNTHYWYRTYARGGYNTRYGEVREFWTKAAADNEGYGSDDFTWEEE